MCFAIPYKVLEIHNKEIIIEGGTRIKLGHELHPSVGDYVQISGTIAVSVIPKLQGKKIHALLRDMNAL